MPSCPDGLRRSLEYTAGRETPHGSAIGFRMLGPGLPRGDHGGGRHGTGPEARQATGPSGARHSGQTAGPSSQLGVRAPRKRGSAEMAGCPCRQLAVDGAENTDRMAGMALNLQLDRESPVPLARQIQEQIERLIREGWLAPGVKLPATRELAQTLGVNRTTVALAYEELVAAGRARAHVGQGTFVAAPPAGGARPRRPLPAASPWTGPDCSRGAPTSGARAPSGGRRCRGGARPLISFAEGTPDSGLFPTDAFRRVLNQVVRTEGAALLQYPPGGDGYLPLRAYLATYLLRFGVEARADDILVVNGSQQGFDLIARTFIDPGDVVAMEQPTYPRAIDVFRAAGRPARAGALGPRGAVRRGPRAGAGAAPPEALLLPADRPQPDGRDDDPRGGAAGPGRRGPAPRAGRRGRLRREPLLRRSPAAPAPGARPGRPRPLHRHLLEGALPGPPARMARGAAARRGAAAGGQAARRPGDEPAHPGRRPPLLRAAPARPARRADRPRVRPPPDGAARGARPAHAGGGQLDRAPGRLLAAPHAAGGLRRGGAPPAGAPPRRGLHARGPVLPGRERRGHGTAVVLVGARAADRRRRPAARRGDRGLAAGKSPRPAPGPAEALVV